jgi:Flp pilus assembly pilin Flp
MLRKILRNKQAQSMVEYGILIGAIAIVSLAATSLLGHKVGDLIGIAAAVLPGAHSDDNGAVTSGHLVNTTVGANGAIGLSTTPAADLGTNLGLGTDAASSLVSETPAAAGAGS